MSLSIDSIPIYLKKFKGKTTKNRSSKIKWWNNLSSAVSSQETMGTDIRDIDINLNDIEILNGFINAFKDLTKIKKPMKKDNQNKAITLFQCLLSIQINDINENDIEKLINSIKKCAEKFICYEEAMEIIVAFLRDYNDKYLQQNSTNNTDDDESDGGPLIPYLTLLGSLLIDITLNDNFYFKLRRESIKLCETCLTYMSWESLKNLNNKIKDIGSVTNNCGDWYLQYLLLKWLSAYYLNCKLCLKEQQLSQQQQQQSYRKSNFSQRSQDKFLKQIEDNFYINFLDKVNIESKQNYYDDDGTQFRNELKELIYSKLFDLTQKEYNNTYHKKKIIITKILLKYNDSIYPDNTVWTLPSINKATIYRINNDDDKESVSSRTRRHKKKSKKYKKKPIYFKKDFKLNLGVNLLYLEGHNNNDEYDDDFEVSITWNGIDKFFYDENKLQCIIYLKEDKDEFNITGTYDDLSYIKLQSDNIDQFDTFCQDFTNLMLDDNDKLNIYAIMVAILSKNGRSGAQRA